MEETKHIRISDYNYPLPDERIAKFPLPVRDQSKLPSDVPRAQALEGMTFSTRTLLRWATWTEACRPQAMRAGEAPVAYALTRALGNRCGEGGKRVLDELVQRVFDISK